MAISLDNFRSQIGVNNYGNVMIANNEVKTVNNGWFARNFDIFKTKISAAQSRETSIQLYQAVKNSISNNGADKASLDAFLQSVANQLGLTVDGERFQRTLATPLDRRVVSNIVKQTDKFKRDVLQCLRHEFDDKLISLAKDINKQRNIFENYEAVNTKQIGSITVTSQKPIYKLKAGHQDRPVPEDKDAALNLLRETLELLNDKENKGMIDSQLACDARDLLSDKETIDSLNFSPSVETRDMIAKLKNSLVTPSLTKLVDRMEVSMRHLDTEIWESDVLLKYFRDEMHHRMNVRGHQHFEELSTTNLKRIASRQYEKVLTAAFKENVFDNASSADITKYLAALCVNTMTDSEFKLNFLSQD